MLCVLFPDVTFPSAYPHISHAIACDYYKDTERDSAAPLWTGGAWLPAATGNLAGACMHRVAQPEQRER